MRHSLFLFPFAALGLAGCVAAPARTVTTTYETPATTTTVVTPAYNAPGQSTTTTYTNPAPGTYVAPGTTSTTTVVHRPY